MEKNLTVMGTKSSKVLQYQQNQNLPLISPNTKKSWHGADTKCGGVKTVNEIPTHPLLTALYLQLQGIYKQTVKKKPCTDSLPLIRPHTIKK